MVGILPFPILYIKYNSVYAKEYKAWYDWKNIRNKYTSLEHGVTKFVIRDGILSCIKELEL